jgi:DNA-binding transcriptional LysR family regulator
MGTSHKVPQLERFDQRTRQRIRRRRCPNARARTPVGVNGPLIVDDVGLVVRAALEGVGLAYLGEDRAAPHLDSCPSQVILAAPPRPIRSTVATPTLFVRENEPGLTRRCACSIEETPRASRTPTLRNAMMSSRNGTFAAPATYRSQPNLTVSTSGLRSPSPRQFPTT